MGNLENNRTESTEIKDVESVLMIQDEEERLQALLEFAGENEKNKEKAMEMAEQIWDITSNAHFLDRFRDEMSKIETKI